MTIGCCGLVFKLFRLLNVPALALPYAAVKPDAPPFTAGRRLGFQVAYSAASSSSVDVNARSPSRFTRAAAPQPVALQVVVQHGRERCKPHQLPTCGDYSKRD
jgi:hypothetical protein